MTIIQKTSVVSSVVAAVLVGGCTTWSGPQKMAFDSCVGAWRAHENGPIGPMAEVYPEGYNKFDYCMEQARRVPSPAMVATANEAGKAASTP